MRELQKLEHITVRANSIDSAISLPFSLTSRPDDEMGVHNIKQLNS